jgi:hypothetical protein
MIGLTGKPENAGHSRQVVFETIGAPISVGAPVGDVG